MATHRRPYVPPPSNTYKGVDAAVALDLLGCNPKSLLWSGQGDWPSQDGERRTSAAKLARDQYAEAISGKAWQSTPQADLLDLDAPSPSYSSSTPASRSVMERADNPAGLWPGDSVFARYGQGGEFYRARVVRVYSSRGFSLADIEWLRPQAGSRADRYFLCSRGLDDTLHRNGLQVGSDVRRQTSPPSEAVRDQEFSLQGVAQPLQPLPAPTAPHRAIPPPIAANSAADLTDLLDLGNASEDLLANTAPPVGSTTASIVGGSPFSQPLPLQASGTELPMNTSPRSMLPPVSNCGWQTMGNVPTANAQEATWSPVGAPQQGLGSAKAPPFTNWTPSPGPVQTIRAQDNFDFVSDMMLQASDSTSKAAS